MSASASASVIASASTRTNRLAVFVRVGSLFLEFLEMSKTFFYNFLKICLSFLKQTIHFFIVSEISAKF